MNFASDNVYGVHPAIMQAMAQANTGTQSSYGSDEFPRRAEQQLCEIFEKGTVRAAMLLASQPSERLSAIRSALAATVRERFASAGRWRVPVPAALVSARK